MQNRLIETMTGKSRICKDGAYVCTAAYQIQIFQDYSVDDSPNNSSGEILGLKRLRGEIVVDDTERIKSAVMNTLMSGSVLTLNVDKPIFGDSTELTFFCKRSIDWMNGKYEIVKAAV